MEEIKVKIQKIINLNKEKKLDKNMIKDILKVNILKGGRPKKNKRVQQLKNIPNLERYRILQLHNRKTKGE